MTNTYKLSSFAGSGFSEATDEYQSRLAPSRKSSAPGELENYNASLTFGPPRHALSRNISRTFSNPVQSGSLTCQSDDLLASQENDRTQERFSAHSSEDARIAPINTSAREPSNRRNMELLSPDQAAGINGRVDGRRRFPGQEPLSPASNYTPQLVLTEAESPPEDEAFASTSSEAEDSPITTEGSKSGAERLAAKRKMKRFRLSHTQTRYLMSEFARQAHPDAAHREKLSRDIEGLTPRKVQVWFQNRRAKLKRLTSDDQERMMNSRALPENFDFSQTLQTSFRDRRPSLGPISPLSGNSPLGGDTNRRTRPLEEQRNMSPNSMASVFNNMAVSSAPASAGPSPVSSIHEGSYYSGSPSPLTTNPQLANPFGRSSSLSTSFQSQTSQNAHLNQGSLNRMRSASLTSPMPSSVRSTERRYDYAGLEPSSATQARFQSPQGQVANSVLAAQVSSQRIDRTQDQEISPISSSDALIYNQSQTFFPLAAETVGYRAMPYSRDAEIQSWQTGQTMLGNLPQGDRFQAQRISIPHNIQPPRATQAQIASPAAFDLYLHGKSALHHQPTEPSPGEMANFPSRPEFQQVLSPLVNSPMTDFNIQLTNDNENRRGITHSGTAEYWDEGHGPVKYEPQ